MLNQVEQGVATLTNIHREILNLFITKGKSTHLVWKPSAIIAFNPQLWFLFRFHFYFPV